jgi:hypothetical protein
MSNDFSTPLEIAQLLARAGTEIYKDQATGLFVVDATVPPTLLTLAQYEAGMHILAIREKAATTNAR